jgi:hypothetical protein
MVCRWKVEGVAGKVTVGHKGRQLQMLCDGLIAREEGTLHGRG